MCRGERQTRLRRDARAALGEDATRLRVRLIVERTDALAVVVVPHDPREGHHRAGGRIRDRGLEGRLVDRLFRDEAQRVIHAAILAFCAVQYRAREWSTAAAYASIPPSSQRTSVKPFSRRIPAA